MKLEPNAQFGQYRIVRLLGRGGMGEVYEVEHTVLQRRYALKLLPPDFASRPEAIQRFEQEARVMANLEHPHIIKVDDFGKTNDRYWLRMELAKGLESGAVTLEEFAATGGGRIRQIEYAGMLYQLLEALAYAHEQGVVHRDLKPGNVLLGTDAAGYLTVKISDFGLARLIGEDVIQSQAQQSVSLGEAPTLGRGEGVAPAQADPEKSTSSRSLLGTWEYMSPEQRQGETADARSDVYSLGLMSYRLLTGKGLEMKLPSQAAPELHQAWDALIARACEQEPGARYANGREMFESLGGVMTVMIEAKEALKQAVVRQAEEARQQQEAARVVAASRGSWFGAMRRRWGWGLGVGAVVLLGVVGWYGGSVQTLHSTRGDVTISAVQALPDATKERPWTNSLGMPFVPVSGTEVLFCVWHVRVQDYQKFVTATDRNWPKPKFAQEPMHPAVNVSWNEAQAFCRWLTKTEEVSKRLPPGLSYRLPKDAEWSLAVGLPPENGNSPKEKSVKNTELFPWGTEWPPPKGAGNYSSSWKVDNFDFTSPVGSFAANRFGLHDMGGNVWQLCEDPISAQTSLRVRRGGAFDARHMRTYLLSSRRLGFSQASMDNLTGFRVVLGVTPSVLPLKKIGDSSSTGTVVGAEGSGGMVGVATSNLVGATQLQPYTNSLGMPFVPVPGTRVLFCRWLTRVQDYQPCVSAVKLDWPSPSREQGPTHPAVNVSWSEAKAYCDWLTEEEQAGNNLPIGSHYRLPTDLEWSVAVGLPAEEGLTPKERHWKIAGVYPWGTNWPPPPGVGNYATKLAVDEYPSTSPVGSFPANSYGLCDMGGNVWQWCEDFFSPPGVAHVVRGASWHSSDSSSTLSSCRGKFPDERRKDTGFRLVLAFDDEPK